jgi:hypothetical protein
MRSEHPGRLKAGCHRLIDSLLGSDRGHKRKRFGDFIVRFKIMGEDLKPQARSNER